jgi:hypothetical protein
MRRLRFLPAAAGLVALITKGKIMKARVYPIIIAWSIAAALGHSSAQASWPPPIGNIVAHNGIITSSPPGTGDVNVDLQYGSVMGPLYAFYHEVATLEAQFLYPDGSDGFWANSTILNSTGVSFTGFEITLLGADFAGYEFTTLLQAPSANPVVDVQIEQPLDEEIGLQHSGGTPFSLLSSSIIRFNDQGNGFTDATLTVLFDDPVNTGAFALWYSVIPSPGAAGATGFTMHMTPIPEPATLCFLALASLIAARLR